MILNPRASPAEMTKFSYKVLWPYFGALLEMKAVALKIIFAMYKRIQFGRTLEIARRYL